MNSTLQQTEEEIIYQNLPSSIGFSLINGAVLAGVMWTVVPSTQIMLWLGLLLLISLIRLGDTWAYQEGKLSHIPYHVRQFTGVMVSASIWGSASFLLFPTDSIGHQVFLAFVIGGMAAGSITVLSPRLPLVVSYILISVVPLMLRNLFSQDSLSVAMGWMLIIFLLGTLLSARRSHLQIADNIRLRIESEEKQRVIQQNQNLVSKAGEIAKIGAWSLREDRQTMEWSDQTYRILNFSNGNEPLLSDFYELIHADYRDSTHCALQALISDQRSFDEEIMLKNNHWLRMMGKCSNGQIEGAIQDISEQKKASQKLLEAKAKAEQASYAKSRFLNNMSHELRTPLNAILGFSQLLELEELNAAQQDYLMEVITAGHHLLDMVNELLEFSRIENNKLKMSLRIVETEELMEEILRMVKPAVSNYHVSLHTQWDAEVNPIEVDKLRLVQSISSFINNMVKQSLEGSRFSLTARNQDENVVIECKVPRQILKQELLQVVNQDLSMADGKLNLDSLSIFLLKKFTAMMHGQFMYDEGEEYIVLQSQFKAKNKG